MVPFIDGWDHFFKRQPLKDYLKMAKLGNFTEKNNLPLQGIKVIEVAEGAAGPFAGRLFAAFGADVIKVERPPIGDWSRARGPFIPSSSEQEVSSLYLFNNTGKKSVLLDWLTPQGMSTLEVLIKQSDIFIEDWDVPFRKKENLNIQKFTEINQDLIEISITPFGLSGPYCEWKSTEIIELALGGFLYLTGQMDREPIVTPGQLPAYSAGLNAYSSALIALHERMETGNGHFLETSILETLATMHQFTSVMETFFGLVRTRHGHRWESKAPFDNYPNMLLPCKDGYIYWSPSSDSQWELLCLMIKRPDLITDQRFLDGTKRRQNAEAIDEILVNWSRQRTKYEIFEEAANNWGLICGPLLTLEEVRKDQQYKLRGLFKKIDHPAIGIAEYPTFPYRMSRTQPRLNRAPLLGEHTKQVLSNTHATHA